jgi:tRNA nucleotidyltransferase (CCA-adding enzyme)
MCKISDDVVAAIMKTGLIYEVGGAVRDKLLKRDLPVKDRDYLVCGVPYKELSKILGKFGEVDLVGRSFGVIKFTQFRKDKKYTFDVALPRREYSTGMGHKDFTVDFDPALKVEDDLHRRDFTINAMAIRLDTSELIDPLDGELDLKNRLLRMVSPESFLEDPLRMLRAVQFAARFDFKIEPETAEAIKKHASLITTVSPERIMEEFNKLMQLAEKPSIGFRLMLKLGLLEHLLPEAMVMVDVEQPGGYHKYDVFEHTMHTIDASPKVLQIRLAALFHDIAKPQTKRVMGDKATFYNHEKISGKIAVKVLRRFRYSKEMISQVQMLVERHMFTTDVTDKGLRRLIKRVGQDLIFDLLDLRRADVEAQGMGGKTDDVDEFEKDIRDEIDRRPPFSVKDLAINGRDIMEIFKLEQSPIIGKVLDYLMEKVLDDPGDNTREKLIEYAKSYLTSNKFGNK